MVAYFTSRRLHSLLGVFPLGALLLVHIYNNAKSLSPDGIEVYNAHLRSTAQIPFRIVFEFLFILAPILIHAGIGIAKAFGSRSNLFTYPYVSNIRYGLHHVAGLVTLIFVGYHLYLTRISSIIMRTPADYLWVVRIFEDPLNVPFYLAGTTAALFYFINGFWNFLIDWGMTVNPRAQKQALYLGAAAFFALAFVNTLTIANFVYHDRTAPAWIAAILRFVKAGMFQ